MINKTESGSNPFTLVAFCVFVLLAAFFGNGVAIAQSSQNDTLSQDSAADTSDTYGTVAFAAIDFSNDDNNRVIGGSAGFVTALNGDISAEGWTLTAIGGSSNVNSFSANSNSGFVAGTVGHLWQEKDYYFTVGAGAHYINDGGFISDEGDADGDELGAIFQYGIETKPRNSIYFQSFGSYSTALQQQFANVKVGYATSSLIYGGEFIYSDSEDSSGARRYGAFITGISLPKNTNVIISGGYEDDRDLGTDDGFYASIGVSVPISFN